MTITRIKSIVNVLSNLFSSRPASANVDYGDGGLRYFLATSSMTTGKPPSDAHIIHMDWDSTGNWASQVAVGTNSSKIWVRFHNGGAWSSWTEVSLSGHGIHVPTPQTANNKVFLRNDNTWQTVTPANIGAATSGHTHDFGVKAREGSASSTAARSANSNFTIDIAFSAEAGWVPSAVIAVKLSAGPALVCLRGFDLDGIGKGAAATLHTYWHTSAAIASGTKVTAFAQILCIAPGTTQ